MSRVALEPFEEVSGWFYERAAGPEEWDEDVLTGERYLLCTFEAEDFCTQVATFVDDIWQSAGVNPRERELVILAVAAALGSRPLWQQHVGLGRAAGLSKGDMRAISSEDLDGLKGCDRAIIRFVRALVDEAVTDEVYADFTDAVDTETAVGIGLLAASYVTIERLLRSLAISVTDPFVGWDLSGL
jgi:alkylhydroperoxidase family enzyme